MAHIAHPLRLARPEGDFDRARSRRLPPNTWNDETPTRELGKPTPAEEAVAWAPAHYNEGGW